MDKAVAAAAVAVAAAAVVAVVTVAAAAVTSSTSSTRLLDFCVEERGEEVKVAMEEGDNSSSLLPLTKVR